MKRFLLIGAAALVLAALAALYIFWWAPGPKAGPHDIVVAEGTTLRSVSRQLAVFRVEGRRAVLARTPKLLDLAGSVPVPAQKRGTSWAEIRRQTREARAKTRA